jgi:prefoldin subunit 5
MNQKQIDAVQKICAALDDMQSQIEILRANGATKAAISEMEFALANIEVALCTHYWYA